MFDTAAQAISFIQGGRATFTIQSAETGAHFTFTAKRAKGDDPKKPFFITHGGDFLGTMWEATDGTLIGKVIVGRKGAMDERSVQARRALNWTLGHTIANDAIPSNVTIQHEGKCCRCNRQLTHPESLASGIGPECAKKM